MGLRRAIARLVASPLFTLFSVMSLAAGGAVTTAVYSVVDSLMLADAGIAEPERAAFVVTPGNGRVQHGALSALDFADLRRSQTSFSSLSTALAITPSVASTANAEIVNAEAVEGGYFATLGVTAQLGRLIQPSDDAGAARVAVISDEMWRSRFASDRGVIGRSLRINAQPFEIIGVAEARYRGAFSLLMMSTRLWIPLGAERLIGTRRPSPLPPRDQRRLLAFGRLAPDRTIEQAAAELATIATRLDRDFPAGGTGGGPAAADRRRWSVTSVAAFHEQDTSLRRFGHAIVALIGLVLLVACTNLANLVLARGAARQGELAVRMAMGASRGRLIWDQCVESLLLAAAGAVASFMAFQAVAAFMTTDYVIVPFGGGLTLSIRPELNPRAVSVALISMLLALTVFGLEPAIQLARSVDIRTALATGATGVRPRVRRQRMVIRWQVAIAAGFFIVATMFIRSTIAQSRHDPGIDMNRVAVAVLNFDNGAWDEARIRRTVDRVFEEAGQQQTIETVAASTGLPFGVPALQIVVTSEATAEAAKRPAFTGVAATPSLFRTLGIQIVHGRGFTDADGPGGAPAIILSELAARQLFGANDAIGRSVMVYRPPVAPSSATIVGVARDTDTRWIDSERHGLVYVPLAQHFAPSITVTARASGDGTLALPALRESIRRADPDLAIDAIGGGDAILSGRLVIVRAMGRGALYLGALTIALSMIGLFGVQSHVVAHRTREIGVRMSVGATASQIKLMVLTDGYRPVVEGLALGLWGGIAGRIMLRSYMDLENVTIVDPWMLVLTPIPLIAAAFWACYLPAAKAARVDPTVALRYQ